MAKAASELRNDLSDALDGGDKAPKKPSVTDVRQRELKGEMIGIVLFFASLAFALALGSYDPKDMEIIAAGRGGEGVANLIGPVGARIADLLLQVVGLGAFLLVGLVGLLGVRTLTGRMAAPKARTSLGIVGLLLAASILLHLGAQKAGWRPYGKEAAGLVPGAIAVLLKALLSSTGTTLLATAMLAASLAAITGRSLTGALLSWLTGRAQPVVAVAASGSADLARSSWESLRNRVGSIHLKRLKHKVDEEADVAEPMVAQAPVAQAPVATAKPKTDAKSDAKATSPEAHDQAGTQDDFTEAAWRLRESRPQPEVQFTVAELQKMWEEQVPGQAREAMPDTAVGLVRGAESAGLPRGEVLGPKDDLVPTAVRRAREQPDISVKIRLPEAQQAGVQAHPDHQLQGDGTPHDDRVSTQQMRAADVRRAYEELVQAEENDLPALDDAAVMPVVEPEIVTQSRVLGGMGGRVGGPRIIETEALRQPQLGGSFEGVQGALPIEGRKWTLPPSTLVQEPPTRAVHLDAAGLRENATILEQKLADFNILGEVTDIRPGPVVTTYEYRPAPGIKISKIVNLRDDLTMSLSALRVRVVAPIPGRDVVGIEVPNHQRQIVYFRELIESQVFREAQSPLTLILGKDIEGRPLCTDLARAPHLLVAGATGTGKSVGINTFIASMLYRCTPDEVRFIMVDPKILELSVYEGIPHLLLPVLDEPRKAELALKWAVVEMDRRYRLLAEAEVRNLAGYKQKLPELRAAALRKKALAQRVDAEGQMSEEIVEMPEDLPYIVVIIDEFADLIMAAGKEVEVPVARLAQKARAAGIHVILATQRPSVDVITGMIKANFPTRVSFQVAQSIDSKVILNTTGAETLLGKGDMLFVPPGEGHLRRCHGTWITDDEVVHLAKHWRDQGSPKYEMDILKDPEADAAAEEDDGEMDPLYDDAVRIAIEANQASVSFLQRKLGIGYGRSARIIDTMERRGIVGPSRGPNKPREILVNAL